MKKYICIGANVESKDGDIHYIRAEKVAERYGLNPNECIFVNNEKDWIGLPDLPRVYPRSDGNYPRSIQI